jgi:hypothetical protein
MTCLWRPVLRLSQCKHACPGWESGNDLKGFRQRSGLVSRQYNADSGDNLSGYGFGWRRCAYLVYISTTLGFRPAAGSGASPGSTRRAWVSPSVMLVGYSVPLRVFWITVDSPDSALSSLEKMMSANVLRSPALAGSNASSVFRSFSSTS